MRLGDKQLELLIFMGGPGRILLTEDRVSRSLVKRGLLHRDKLAGVHVSPAGLRAVANAMERGRIDAILDAARKKVAGRQQQ